MLTLEDAEGEDDDCDLGMLYMFNLVRSRLDGQLPSGAVILADGLLNRSASPWSLASSPAGGLATPSLLDKHRVQSVRPP